MLILLSNSVVQQQRHSLDDEEEIIGFEDTDIQAGIDKCSRSLMGRIMVVRLFSAETIKSALYAFWRQLEGFKVQSYGGNIFQFYFDNEIDVTRIERGARGFSKNSLSILDAGNRKNSRR
ncbi:DUF4283 domain protein [Arachis hypogaea]|nr:DUF4283 domain protein [Arachis hypogaea]